MESLMENIIFYFGIALLLSFFLEYFENHSSNIHGMSLLEALGIFLVVLAIGLKKLFPSSEKKDNPSH